MEGKPLAPSFSRCTLRRNWEAFWAHRVAPLHKRDAGDFYAEHAADLRLLFAKLNPRTVLELGCGNGAMYSYLGFEGTAYKGVDFSKTMLRDFAARYPGVELECGNIASFADERQYDLIFMESVAQYCDPDKLATVFKSVRSLMHKESVFTCSSIPLKAARAAYMTGALAPPTRRSLLAVVKGRITASLPWPDSMGYWYEPRWVAELATNLGMRAEFYGCHSYVYR